MSTYHFDIDATLSIEASSPEQAQRIFDDYINFVSTGIPRADFDLYDYDIRVDADDELEDSVPSSSQPSSYTSFSSLVLSNAVQEVSQEIVRQRTTYTPLVSTVQEETLPSIPGYNRLRTTRS